MITTDYVNWIVSKLSTITDLIVADSASLDATGTPLCRVVLKSFEQRYEDNRTIRLIYVFELYLSISVNDTLGGIKENEQLLEGLVDQVLAIFNDPTNRHSSVPTNGASDIVLLERGSVMPKSEAGSSVFEVPMDLKITTLQP